MSLSCRRIASLVTAWLVVTSASTTARAECGVELGGVGLAFIWPEQDCRHNLHADLRWGLYGTSRDALWRTEIGAEVGLLERIDASIVQIGPVVAFGGSGQTHDWEGDFDEAFVSPRVRARMWMLDEWLTFEAAAGPTFWWIQGARGEWLRRVGPSVELGPSFHGAAGLFVGTSYLPPAADQPSEWRTTLGVRMNLTLSAIVAATTGLVYACSRSPGAC